MEANPKPTMASSLVSRFLQHISRGKYSQNSGSSACVYDAW